MKRIFVLGLGPSITALALASACGSSPSTAGTGGGTSTSSGTGGAGASSSSGSGTGTGGSIINLDSGACTNGEACGDGGVCVNGMCCDSGIGCGTACCAAGDVCNFQTCETPGAPCVDASDCPTGYFCDYSLGPPVDQDAGSDAGTDGGACMGGAVVQTGRCLSQPPECAPGQDPGDPITCITKCEYIPPVNDFTPVQKYAWGGQTAPPYASDVMMAPIVIQLDDDNCDGKVNQNDIPEIVFSTFTGGGYYKQGTLHAISVINGAFVDKWSKPNVTQPGGGLAAADLDGDGVPEIVGCMNPGPNGANCCDALAQNTGVIAFRADGSTYWTQPDTTQVHCGYESPVIADLNQDGNPEIIVGWTILDGKTGAVIKNLDPAVSATYGVKLVGVADVDGDGMLDITDGQRAYKSDGTVIWDLRPGGANPPPTPIPRGYHAIGDFDKDGKPEIVVISTGGPHTMSLVQYDASLTPPVKVIRTGVDINNGISTAAFCSAMTEYGGGPPTVADFDGDGFPDVGAAGAVGYIVFSGKNMMDPAKTNAELSIWFKTTHDCSSAVTGSSVFDFNGDGKAEVIYSDEYHLWMYDGATGGNLIPSTCNTTGTLWEYPLVADVDNDGEADIVVASNAYAITCPDNASKQSGIRVFGSAQGSWVRTRRVWNQHTYHITNIGEDGKVPAVEVANWTVPGLNNYRQNKQPGSQFAAPDVVVSVGPYCGMPYGLVATVRNLGEAPLPAGVVVGFYEGAPPAGVLLGQALTTKVLYPAEAENVILSLPNAPPEITSGMVLVYAVADDGMPTHTWHECRTDNNISMGASGACSSPK